MQGKVYSTAIFAQKFADLSQGKGGAMLVIASSEDEARGVVYREAQDFVSPKEYMAPAVLIHELTVEELKVLVTALPVELLADEIARRVNQELDITYLPEAAPDIA